MLSNACGIRGAHQLRHDVNRWFGTSTGTTLKYQRARRIRQDRRVPKKEIGANRCRSDQARSAANAKNNRPSTATSSGAATAEGGAEAFSGEGPYFSSQPLAWYSHKLETHPLTTKCLTSGFIAGSGDILCQFLVHRNENGGLSDEEKAEKGKSKFHPDLHRTRRFTFLGFAFIAPIVHFWYAKLVALFPGKSMSQVLKRLFFDQGFFAPLFIPAFMVNLMILEGRPLAEFPQKLKQDLPGALVANWCLWIPAMLVNFRFVPLKFQVLFGNMVGFIWNCYLSWKTQDAGDMIAEKALAESRL